MTDPSTSSSTSGPNIDAPQSSATVPENFLPNGMNDQVEPGLKGLYLPQVLDAIKGATKDLKRDLSGRLFGEDLDAIHQSLSPAATDALDAWLCAQAESQASTERISTLLRSRSGTPTERLLEAHDLVTAADLKLVAALTQWLAVGEPEVRNALAAQIERTRAARAKVKQEADARAETADIPKSDPSVP